MGSSYVNDFDFNNRAYRVYVQADQTFRRQPRDIRQFYVRSDTNDMVPLDNVVNITESTSPQVITHYNLFRSAEIDGSAGPGYSSGQAIAAMDECRQEIAAGLQLRVVGTVAGGNQVGQPVGTAVRIGLAAGVSDAVGAVRKLRAALHHSAERAHGNARRADRAALRGQLNDVYCQIGLVMLIGLASKNGILIVEFAEQLRHKGLSIKEAAVEAARIRLRPILMTSFAFILGVLPLVFASGAGSQSRHSVGTTVFGGMIVSTALNLFFIPVLYVIVKTMVEREQAPAVPSASA